MRLFHNFFQMFKKDSGAHFAYNLGVSYMRFSVVVFVLFAVLTALAILQPENRLYYRCTIYANVLRVNERIEKRRFEPRSSEQKERIEYTAVLEGNTDDGEHIYLEQDVTVDEANMFSKKIGDKPEKYNLYYSIILNKHYISPETLHTAQENFRSINHSPYFAAECTAAVIFFLLTLIFIAIGVSEIRVSMKYPRNDVPTDITDIVVRDENTEELLEEFDEAYRKTRGGYVGGRGFGGKG